MPFMNDDKRFIKPAALRDFRLQAKERGWPAEYTAHQVGMVKMGVRDGRLHDSCVLLLDNMCTEEEYEQLFYAGIMDALKPLYNIVTNGYQHTEEPIVCARCEQDSQGEEFCEMCRVHEVSADNLRYAAASRS